MIDLHCHILPQFKIDVGHSLGEEIDEVSARQAAVAACRQAAQQGITHIVATPHIHADNNLSSAALIPDAAAALQQWLHEDNLSLEIVPGAEVAISEDLPEIIDSHPELVIASKCYVLIEPPFFSLPLATESICNNLVTLGYRPILAHPERSAELQNNTPRLREIVDAGAFVQITAAGLIGWMGRKVRRSCESFLQEGLVHFIASDAHFGGDHLNALIPVWQRLTQLGGTELAARLLVENPRAAIEGQTISSENRS